MFESYNSPQGERNVLEAKIDAARESLGALERQLELVPEPSKKSIEAQIEVKRKELSNLEFELQKMQN